MEDLRTRQGRQRQVSKMLAQGQARMGKGAS